MTIVRTPATRAGMTVISTVDGYGNLPPGTYIDSWDGTNDARDRVPDGRYTARLAVSYLNGDAADSATPGFTVDTVAPSISVAWQRQTASSVPRRVARSSAASSQSGRAAFACCEPGFFSQAVFQKNRHAAWQPP